MLRHLVNRLPYALRTPSAKEYVDDKISFQVDNLLPYYLPGLGVGEFVEEGEELLAMLRELGKLKRSDRILDLGCGLGRVALPLQRFLGSGSYEGLDVVAEIVHWNRVNITRVSPRFHFRHLDVRSTSYNPEGAMEPAAMELPYDDGVFTFAFATSLFSHLLADATLRYLAELARVLRPRRRAVLTFFLLDDATRRKAERGETDLPLPHRWERGLLGDAERPEDAVAYDEEWLFERIEESGFRLERVARGRWSGHRDAPSYQDVVVLRR